LNEAETMPVSMIKHS